MNLCRNVFHLVLFLFLIASTTTRAKEKNKKLVMVLEIKKEIDPRMSRYVKLALEAATAKKADIILVHMDTYGGAVNDADLIRTAFLDEKRPVWVYINKNAASAGALISIACDSIYMSPGANIGAATVVVGGSGEAAPDKYQSYMRSMMRSTAEANDRDPSIAERMVDQDLSIDSVTKKGKVVTLTTQEAMEQGFCEGEVNSLEEILERNGVEDYTLETFTLDGTEKVIAVFLNPFISGILILVIIGGIYFELQTPGVGFPLAAAIIAAILYFIPYYLTGLAANWEILLFFIGIILLAVEIFVIPGFGVAGISGIALIVISLILVMLENNNFDFTYVPIGNLVSAVTTVFTALLLSLVLLFVGGMRLANSQFFKRVSLETTMDSKEGYTASFVKHDMIGQEGIAQTVLRPSGKVLIGSDIYDATTRGEFIEKGKAIVVLTEDSNTLKVKEKA